MGLTFNLGRVSPSVFTDSSLNVGIGGSPSGSYKLEVTGTAKVSTSAYFATASGSVGIGTSSPGATFEVKCAYNGSANDAIYFSNSGAKTLFEIRSDGYFNTGNATYSPYNVGITASIKACYIDTYGNLGYNGSTRESKININKMDNANWINQLNPVTFHKRKKDDEGNFTDEYYDELHYGFIADEMEAVNTDFVFYDEKDGEKKLAGIHYDRMIAPLVKAIQEMNTKLDAQNQTIQNLQEQNQDLKSRLDKAGL